MDFIVDNYFWFIVGGIVVLMIIIGFIAEKTDFGRKPFREKKVDNKNNNEPNEQLTDESIEEQIVAPEVGLENSEEFMMQDGFEESVLPEAEVELSEPLAEEVSESDTITEPIEESVIEEPMVDLDIPEIAEDKQEVAPEVSDVIEEVVDDSEDDVWKF